MPEILDMALTVLVLAAAFLIYRAAISLGHELNKGEKDDKNNPSS